MFGNNQVSVCVIQAIIKLEDKKGKNQFKKVAQSHAES